MEFCEFTSQFSSGIKAIAHKHRPQSGFIDESDLVQEALVSLWLKWKEGKLSNKNKSYILKGCYFEMKNFLRKSLDSVTPVSLNTAIDEEGTPLEEVIPDERLDNSENNVEAHNLIDEIRNDGLTIREKEVFEYFLKGFNVRQIGEKLGISHVRVVKIEKNIWQKARTKIGENKD